MRPLTTLEKCTTVISGLIASHYVQDALVASLVAIFTTLGIALAIFMAQE